MRIFKKPIVILTVVMGIVGILGFLNWQRNAYSKDVLKLEILGPAQAHAGEEIEYVVKYKNNGNFRLENPELIFEAPSYSLLSQGASAREILNSEKLGEAVYPGQEQTFSFKARLLGKEGEAKIAKASLSYQPKNLKARYESKTTLATIIKSVPITLDLDVSSKIESGKEFVSQINYFSNVNFSLLGLRAQVEYPSGFEFVRSIPKSLGQTEWDIPVLNKSQGGRIEISGKISGEIGEAKIFKAKLGIWQEGKFIELKEVEKAIEVIRPSIYIRQEINNNPEYVASPGDWLHYQVYFKNIGEDDLSNLFMISQLEGDAFDFGTLKSDRGAYQPGDNSVVFDWKKVSKLQYLAPLDEGKADFWIRLKDDLGNVKNPILRNKIFISQIKQEFITKISSKMEVVQKGYFQDEVFGNTGPIPPRVGETTTYTITWQAKNYYADARDVKIKAVLPLGVELAGRVFPEEESARLSFDSESREVVWSLGDLKRGQGVSEAGPNLTFQIVFTPNYGQRGQTPDIIGPAEISGQDAWTDSTIKGAAPAIDTSLPDDGTVSPAFGIVQ